MRSPGKSVFVLSHAIMQAKRGGHVTIPCYNNVQKEKIIAVLKLIDPDFGLLPITIEVLHDA